MSRMRTSRYDGGAMTDQFLLPGFGPDQGMGDIPAQIGRAEVTATDAREILTRASGFLAAYDFTLNPYSGCGFGCTYCYAAFFSRDQARLDSWGRWVEVKRNASSLLAKRRRGSLDGKLIYMSSVTDPYQPVEQRLGITRSLLQEIVDRGDRPRLVVQTRGPGVVRDCDLLARIEANGGRVQVNMTVTTDDEDIRRSFEPTCPSNQVRLDAVAQVGLAGITTCITVTPLLLVRDPEAFAAAMLATGAERFIAQPFHVGQGQFVAGTRDAALDLMAGKLGCERGACHREHQRHYRMVVARLRAALPELGEGKDGFAPPF